MPLSAVADEAHPRLRGADLKCLSLKRADEGSSPLTRGGLFCLLDLLCLVGLIPAYAGRTSVPLRFPHRSWAHPRLRGADFSGHFFSLMMLGSSPLTRGGLVLLDGRSRQSGLIPAYAGRTHHATVIPTAATAHPRLRGADDSLLVDVAQFEGSSPLTRRGLPSRLRSSSSLGLIPAYAGRTLAGCLVCAVSQAHPRLRGADYGNRPTGARERGSSPLTRGGRYRGWVIERGRGLIPAYAGRTAV